MVLVQCVRHVSKFEGFPPPARRPARFAYRIIRTTVYYRTYDDTIYRTRRSEGDKKIQQKYEKIDT